MPKGNNYIFFTYDSSNFKQASLLYVLLMTIKLSFLVNDQTVFFVFFKLHCWIIEMVRSKDDAGEILLEFDRVYSRRPIH